MGDLDAELLCFNNQSVGIPYTAIGFMEKIWYGEKRGAGKDSKTVSSKFSSQSRKVGDMMSVDDCPDKSASSVFKQMCPQKFWA